MSFEDLSISVTSAVFNSLAVLIGYLPSLVAGLVVFLIGLLVAAIVYRVIIGILKSVQLEKFLVKYGVTKVEGKEIEWAEILGELARWIVIIVFLIPAMDAWRLNSVTTVLNRVILYIPNVIVAVVLAMIGLVFARIGYRVSYGASRSLGKDTAHSVGLVAQWSIVIFVAFLVLHQLGVAQELLRILFAGVVAMVAIAGGLAFGLGGQGVAKSLMEAVFDRFKK